MEKIDIISMLTKNVIEVIPSLASHEFVEEDSLKSLGANSMDRSDIIIMTMEDLSLRVPLIEFAKAKNIGMLAEIFLEKHS